MALKDATIEAKDRTIAALRGELVARSPAGTGRPPAPSMKAKRWQIARNRVTCDFY
jgi:hypothetical protein